MEAFCAMIGSSSHVQTYTIVTSYQLMTLCKAHVNWQDLARVNHTDRRVCCSFEIWINSETDVKGKKWL